MMLNEWFWAFEKSQITHGVQVYDENEETPVFLSTQAHKQL